MFKSICGLGLFAILTTAVSGQVVLSDFTSGVDGWSGAIVGNTPFANGFTAVSQVDESGNKVLNLNDGGFGGGASKIYNVTPENNVVTVVADLKIQTDPTTNGTLGPDMGFAIKIGSGVGTQQEFAYSKTRGTTGNDSGQSFIRVATSVFTGNNTAQDIVAAVTPDKIDWSVGSGTWDIRLDNVKQSVGGTLVNLDTFDSAIANWSATSNVNSPFIAGTTFVTFDSNGGNGVVNISDGGFTGGAVGVYSGAFSSAGVHTILADVRIVSETGSLVQARLAAAPGATTNASDLNWSSSFSTSGDDTGQAFKTVAVPVETTGAGDLALYVFPDYDAAVGSGAWTIQVDNVRFLTNQTVPVGLSSFSLE